MYKIITFEDLEIWKKPQEPDALVYQLYNANLKIAKDILFKTWY